MDLAVDEFSVSVYPYPYKRCVAGKSLDTHSGGAEVAKAVCDETVSVEFNGSDHVRAVSVDYVRSAVYCKVGEIPQEAPLVTVEILGTVRQVPCCGTLPAAVEADDYNVAAFLFL